MYYKKVQMLWINFNLFLSKNLYTNYWNISVHNHNFFKRKNSLLKAIKASSQGMIDYFVKTHIIQVKFVKQFSEVWKILTL